MGPIISLFLEDIFFRSSMILQLHGNITNINVSTIDPVRTLPMSGRRSVEEIGSAAMLVSKRSAGVAPEVNLKESVTCTPLPSGNKAAHSGFET